MIKKIRIELILVILLFLSIFISTSIGFDFSKIFNSFNEKIVNLYFKNFFVNITIVGDSIWIFSTVLILYVLCFLLQIFFGNKLKEVTNKIKFFCLYLFLGTLITGALTQVIKHLVGRPRPNYFLEGNNFGVNFFSFDSAFHSFPSGHTSTIFLVALILSVYTPKIKFFYFFFAGLVALSRVVVGAHYFTDVIAGAVIAFIGFKITTTILENFNKSEKIFVIKGLNSNHLYLSLVVFFIFVVFVSLGNSFDMYISNLFYYGEQQFFLQSFDIITVFARKIFLPFLLIYILILPIFSFFLPINKIYFNFQFKYHSVFFVFLSLIINLIFVVNLVLKNIWGRARPNDILQFGGNDDFSPWYQYSNACDTNCSFVSGDASVGFSLIALYFVTKNNSFFWASLFAGVFIGFIRILEGGHFFSDILLAGFLIYVLTFLQFHFYKKKFYHDL